MKTHFFIFFLIFGISQTYCVKNSYVESRPPFNTNGNSNQNASNNRVVDEQLEFNRKLWMKNNIKDYIFEMEIHEVGLSGLSTRVEIKVIDGKPVDFGDSKVTQNANHLKDRLEPYSTLEKLFDFIHKKFEQKQNYLDTGKPMIGKLNVSYDPKLGFPNQINYTPFSGAMDGDLYISIKNFVNLRE